MRTYCIDEITLIEIDALIAMAKANVSGGSRMDRIVRTVTEALSFGKFRKEKPVKYCNSTEAKAINRRMSRAAAELMPRCTKQEFQKKTILEHQMTIGQLRAQLSSRIGLDRRSVIEILSSHPLVTVTSDGEFLVAKEQASHQGWTAFALQPCQHRDR